MVAGIDADKIASGQGHMMPQTNISVCACCTTGKMSIKIAKGMLVTMNSPCLIVRLHILIKVLDDFSLFFFTPLKSINNRTIIN